MSSSEPLCICVTTRRFAMDWMSLAKQSKQLAPNPHCSRPRLLPLRFQTQRQACGQCRVCLFVKRLQTLVLKTSIVLQAAVPKAGPRTQAEITSSGSNYRRSPTPSSQRQGTQHRSFRRGPPLLFMHPSQRRDIAGLVLWLRLAFASSSAWSGWVCGC